MTFHIFTIFPEAIKGYFETSILKRAQQKKLIKIKIYDIRKYAKDKHKTTDDKPFGGGPGMVMKIEPIVKAIKSKVKSQKSKILVILTSATGKQFEQKMASNFSKKYKDIAIICGRYEGIDERLKKILRDLGYNLQELSIGPYILTGGEIPAMAVVDAVSRHLPGVLGKKESLEEIKGSYPVYTRPEVFFAPGGKKYKVPKVLLSGNHKKIKEWRVKRGKL
ncbi:tRNA (guanosine(37)-N1)-methyltransferase TrmD [Patescibacteria group bacterium]|nr:tRNA (guanosine(37)-N1)-methyltransferase TrmD [Patescibacteria group bacterium]